MQLQPFETFSDHLFLCFHLFSPATFSETFSRQSAPFLATFSRHLFKTLRNITKRLKPYETFANLSKRFKTFQNLSKPFKTFQNLNLSKPLTFQNLSKPFLSKIFLPNKLQYKNHAGRPGAALLSHMTTPSSVVSQLLAFFWLLSCHVSLGEEWNSFLIALPTITCKVGKHGAKAEIGRTGGRSLVTF